jgi:hypothetical protein
MILTGPPRDRRRGMLEGGHARSAECLAGQLRVQGACQERRGPVGRGPPGSQRTRFPPVGAGTRQARAARRRDRASMRGGVEALSPSGRVAHGGNPTARMGRSGGRERFAPGRSDERSGAYPARACAATAARASRRLHPGAHASRPATASSAAMGDLVDSRLASAHAGGWGDDYQRCRIANDRATHDLARGSEAHQSSTAPTP